MPDSQFQDTHWYDDIAPETCIRIQDEVMVNWLRDLRFRKQSPKVQPSWMSKQFSQKKELHNDPTQRLPMPYPMIALSVGSITPDLQRRQFNTILTQNKRGRIYADPAVKDFVYEVPWPLPIRIPYTIDIYAKTRQDLRLLETAIMARFAFADMMYLKATFPGYGELLLRLTFERNDETSELETGEKERELRKTISTVMDGWIFRTPIKRRTIKEGHVVVVDATGDLINDQEFLDWFSDLDNITFDPVTGAITDIDEKPSSIPPDRILLWVSFDSTGLTGSGPST